MLVLVGSKNPLKAKSAKNAFEEVFGCDVTILPVEAESGVSSKPIGFEIIRGCENRNKALQKFAQKNSIQYDYLCSIEGGYSLDENGLPFVDTYSIVETADGRRSTGRSLGIRIPREMYRYVRDGGSFNKLIAKITGEENTKQKTGLMGFLTNDMYVRDKVDKDCVCSALVPIVFADKFKMLTETIEREEHGLNSIEQFSGTENDVDYSQEAKK